MKKCSLEDFIKRFDKEIGKKYGMLTVLSVEHIRDRADGGRTPVVKCRCDCGGEKIVLLGSIKSGITSKCMSNVHSPSKHPLRPIYRAMISRCTNPKNQSYKNYGGRGITVCYEWLNDFNKFVEWCDINGYKKGLDIDRRNNDLGYSPENCRVATKKQNANNTRSNVFVDFNGERLTIACVAEKYNLNYKSLWAYLKGRGKSLKHLAA